MKPRVLFDHAIKLEAGRGQVGGLLLNLRAALGGQVFHFVGEAFKPFKPFEVGRFSQRLDLFKKFKFVRFKFGDSVGRFGVFKFFDS